MWAFKLNTATELSTNNISIQTIEHFGSGHVNFYLVSPHLNEIAESDSVRAYYRSNNLLLLLNVAWNFATNSGENKAKFHKVDLHYFLDDFASRKYYREEDLEIELEELAYPFNVNLKDLSMINKKNDIIDNIFALAMLDPLVRENLILFGLSGNDSFYLLINVYKICENIEFDIVNNLGMRTDAEPFTEYFAPFKKFNHYINTKAGSGFFARHGSDTKVFNKQKPTHTEIINATYELLRVWMNYKMQIISR